MPSKTSSRTKPEKTRTAKKVTKQQVKKIPAKSVAKQPKSISKSDDARPYKLPSVYRLTRQAWEVLWRHRKLFAGLTIVYGLLNLILVQGLASSTDVASLKKELDSVFTGNAGALVTGVGVFAVLVSSAGNSSSQTAGAYQIILSLITSLAVIWSLRQVMMDKTVRVKDAYYQGMYPFIPLVLVMLVIVLQLLPLLIGAGLYSIVVSNGIAIGIIEKLAFGLVALALACWTIYMLSSSIFAIYIVTLPDMTPRKALKSAKGLVKSRRWSVIRKIIALPIILLIVSAVIMLPIILIITPLAQWVFFILTMFGLVALHTYLYTLYRDLLA